MIKDVVALSVSITIGVAVGGIIYSFAMYWLNMVLFYSP